MSEYGELERGNLLCIIDWIFENAAIDGGAHADGVGRNLRSGK